MANLFRKCPICASEKGEVLHEQKFTLTDDHILPNSYSVVCCDVCSFVYADTEANQSKYDLYYAKFSKYEDIEVSSGGNHPWEIKRYERVVDDISIHIEKESTILDVGCANGGLLSYFKSKGYNNLLGLDPSFSCVQYVQSQEIKAVKGDLFNNQLLVENKKFDVVIFSHVFEHLYDLKKSVENASKYLNENGLLYIEVPNAAEYRNYYKVPYYYFDIEHINHFTTCSLNNLILQEDFESIESIEKEIPVTLTEKYPALYGLYRKKKVTKEYNLMPDKLAKNSILDYIALSEFKSGYKELVEISKSKVPVVVWGAGQYALRILNNTPLKEANIIAFIDNDRKKHQQIINQVQIYPPTYLQTINYNGPIIVISALFSKEISEEIKLMNLGNEIIEIR